MNMMEHFFNEVLEQEFVSNVNNMHEERIQETLESHGFNQQESFMVEGKQTHKKIKESLLKIKDNQPCREIKNNHFVYQPFGSQQSPDFIVNYNNKIFFIECKSSKAVYPTYNSGLPVGKYIYIFTSKKYNETTIFKGSDIVGPDARKKLEEHLDQCRQQDKKLNKSLKETGSSHGLSFYTRPMYTSVGGAAGGADYFKNKNRKQIEQKTIQECQ